MNAARLAHALHVFARRLFAAVGDVFIHRARKKPCVLQDHGVIEAQAAARQIFDWLMVKRNLAAIHIVKAHQQIDDGRFARARRAHNGHKRALRHMQREIFDDLSVLCVAEVHVRKVYVTLCLR